MKKKIGAFGTGQFSLGTLVGGQPGTTIFQNPGVGRGGGGGWGGRIQGPGPAAPPGADNHRRTPPPPPTKVTIVGKNEIYNRAKLIGPLWCTNFCVPDTPPSLLMLA